MGRPRATPVFRPTMEGHGPVRSGNILKDPRYGQMAPHHGMPHGHLPVTSYMAVPVTGRTGEVIGALLFGHSRADAFTAEHEALVLGVAGHAAIALDNASLHKAAQTEVAQRKRAEETKDLLLHEIKHRVKNTLGTVQAIAAQTFRAAPTEEREAFGARLRAMSEAHDLLTNQDWGHVKVAVVVARAIAPFDHQRFIQDGDDTLLPASEALLLAMALHELGTNAVKYGALSNRTGHVTLHWQTQDGKLVFRWGETGGPPVTPPTRKGFGTNLLLRAITGDQGKARMDFRPTGLEAMLEMRLTSPTH
jgi:two-component sensor histidine kinase